MSRRPFKAQASSSRVVPSPGPSGKYFGNGSVVFGGGSSLSYLAEQPDVSSLSDANVAVYFKNLSKKADTTKAKALEDLQSYLSSAGTNQDQVDEQLLEAWVKVFPRLAIDGSRRVRQLSQTIQGYLGALAGKRVAKYMPQVVGSWKAGVYDGDKMVERAARESLHHVFPNPEKLQSITRVYQQALLKFCSMAILEETPATLSDERNTSDDDMQAKYNRLISSCLSLFTELVQSVSDDERGSCEESYTTIIASEKLWELASSKDSAVRRCVYALLSACLERRRGLIEENLNVVSTSILSKHTINRQTGSALAYSEVLLRLSSKFPQIWSLAAGTKGLASEIYFRILKSGSHGSQPAFWDNLSKMFVTIPKEALPDRLDMAKKALECLRNGITKKDEPRTNVTSAWNCYFTVASRLTTRLSESEREALFLQEEWPLALQYLVPSSETAQWAVLGPSALKIVVRAARKGLEKHILGSEWSRLSQDLIKAIQTSQPEQSKDFLSSQLQLTQRGQDWYALQAQILNDPEVTVETTSLILSSFEEVMSSCMIVLVSRAGKPFGAAEVMNAALRASPNVVLNIPKLDENVSAFLLNNVPNLILSPSGEALTSTVYLAHRLSVFKQSWDKVFDVINDAPNSPQKDEALLRLFCSAEVPEDMAPAELNPKAKQLVSDRIRNTLSGLEDWSFLERFIPRILPNTSGRTIEAFLEAIAHSMGSLQDLQNAILGLKIALNAHPASVKAFMSSHDGPSMLQNLLLASESENDLTSTEATALTQKLESLTLTDGQFDASVQSSEFIIAKELSQASSSSLSIDTLITLAKKMLKTFQSENIEDIKTLLPGLPRWNEELLPFLKSGPPMEISILDEIGGGIYLVQKAEQGVNMISRDLDGYSIPLRNAMYTTRLCEENQIFERLDASLQADVYRLLAITIGMVNDKINIFTANKLWSILSPDVEDEMTDLVSRATRSLLRWQNIAYDLPVPGNDDYSQIYGINKVLIENTNGSSSSSFYHARTFAKLMKEELESRSLSQKARSILETELKERRKSSDDLTYAAFLVAFQSPLSGSASLSRIFNELIADLTGTKPQDSDTNALKRLVVLNLMLRDQEKILETVAKQRLIFFIQHLVAWLVSENVNSMIKGEICKALTHTVAGVAEIYGTFWSQILTFISSYWSMMESSEVEDLSTTIPVLHATLRLTASLRKIISSEDTNDDLAEAWTDSSPTMRLGLLKLLLHAARLPSDALNKSIQIVNELLSRAIATHPLPAGHSEELYPLLMVKSLAIQQVAFESLHNLIPAQQEDLSVEIALQKNGVARFPEELLSLILEPPTLGEKFVDLTNLRVARGYLHSWILVFDHFQNASDKVRGDYVDHLKDYDCFDAFLGYLLPLMGLQGSKLVDVSRFDFSVYHLEELESPVKEIQVLLAHLYYLALKFLPSLVKSWWRDTKSRQLEINLPQWTEKYYSPFMISEALQTVAKWASTQDSTSEDSLVIKTNPRTKAITASREIDDQTLTITITLPDNFPLGQVLVQGVSRVAVAEKRWNHWLNNTQGVIQFSDNNIVEGLIAFRKNVSGAMKGQSECAICYSIVGTDKQLPTMKCGTCKNLFHKTCLYRWFKTSNSSSCPLCRNAFTYS